MSQLKTDEEIVESTNYNFTLKVDKLLDNSTTTRRAKRQQRAPKSNLNYVPHPQNPFILYRRDMVARSEFTGLKSSEISKKNRTNEEKMNLLK